MLAAFLHWWIARITELLPTAWVRSGTRPRDGIVIDAFQSDSVFIRRAGRLQPSSLGAAARLAGRMPVFIRPAASAVLVKHHVVPTTALHDLPELLRYELGRITPFKSEDLFWRWDSEPGRGDKTEVALTLVPKEALATALTALDGVSLKPDFIEVGLDSGPVLLPASPLQSGPSRATRLLGYTCALLALVSVLLPVALQEIALRATDDSIAALQPSVKQVEALRRGMAASGTTAESLRAEADRVGDLLQVLATVTRILPDDSYLTDLALRERQLTISGRTASAPRLITSLADDPVFRDPAFAAPVTRIEGATSDLFSLKALISR